MTSSGKNRWLVVLVFALLGSAAWAGEPNEIPIRLEFEISPTPLGPYPPFPRASVVWPLADRRPAYAAAIPLVPPVDWLPSPLRRTMSGFLGQDDTRLQKVEGYAEIHGGLSESQKAFLQITRNVSNHPTSSFVQNRPDPNGPECVLLFAVDLDDAKKMAQAYYTYARNDWWRRYVIRLNSRIRDLTQTVAQEETRAAEIDQTFATTQKSLTDLVKTVPYRTEAEAHGAIGELDRMLTAAEVEIAGIRAKMQAIMNHQRESAARHRSQDFIERLDMMYIDESIVLQGTEARKQMATRLREQANRYVDLKSTLTRTAAERKTLGESLDAHGKDLAIGRKELERTNQQEPKIPAKVVLYPVQWTAEPPGNN